MFQNSKEQLQILHFLVNEQLTPKQIAIRRKTTTQAVYKIIHKLLKKKLLKLSKSGMFLRGGCTQTLKGLKQPHLLRLHREQIKLKILYQGKKYQRIIKNNIKDIIDNNTLLLYKKVIIVHSSKSFYGRSTKECNFLSEGYWIDFIKKVENKYKITILGYRTKHFTVHRKEYAETNNEFAEDSNKRGDKLIVRASEDKKEWLKIDRSLNIDELETCHPKTAERDMDQIIQPFFIDLRENRPPVLSALYKMMVALGKIENKRWQMLGFPDFLDDLKESKNNKETQSTLKDIKEEVKEDYKPDYFG